MEQNCIFCSIASGRSNADIVHETDTAIFFHDISPKAPVHVVVATKQHFESLAAVEEKDSGMLGKILSDITAVADKVGLKEGGYRVITNVGADAGQEVKHLHWHILGGEGLGPLRC